jgi:chemotaxis protein MotD
MNIVVPRGGDGTLPGNDKAAPNQQDGAVFSALLDKIGASTVALPTGEASPAEVLILPTTTPKPDAVEIDALLAEFLPDDGEDADLSDQTTGDEAVAEAPLDQQGSDVAIPLIGAAIAAAAPKVMNPATGAGVGVAAQRSSAPDTLSGVADDVDIPEGASVLVVKVRGQETHFKPVVEGFTTKLADPVRPDGATQPATDLAVKAEGEPVRVPAHQMLGLKDAGQSDGKSDLATVGLSAGSEPAAGGFTPQTLQKITGSILSEAKHLTSAPRPQFMEALSPSFVATARASDTAVRHLTLDLNPVDLGRMTVSMKLSGDVLEMTVSVAHEEVAAMLRRDNEGLSSALRAAGYRPEIVSIQVNPANHSGEAAFSGSRQQEFQQGPNNGAGHNHRESQGRDREFEGRNKNGSEDNSGAGDARRTIDGVYL